MMTTFWAAVGLDALVMSADGLAISFVIMVRLQRTPCLNSGFVPRAVSAIFPDFARFAGPAVEHRGPKSLLTPKGSIFLADKRLVVHGVSRAVAGHVPGTALSAHDQHRGKRHHLSQLH